MEFTQDEVNTIKEGLGSALWVFTNIHNHARPEFVTYAKAAEKDTKRAYELIRGKE